VLHAVSNRMQLRFMFDNVHNSKYESIYGKNRMYIYMQCVTVQLSLRWQTSLSMPIHDHHILGVSLFSTFPPNITTFDSLACPTRVSTYSSSCLLYYISTLFFIYFIILLWYSKIKSILFLLLLLLLSP
jgi:hypothetical protein